APAAMFFLGLAFPLTVTILIALFVIPPGCAVAKSLINLFRRYYRSAVAFALVPVMGFGVFTLSTMLFVSAITKIKIASYRNTIETAVANHSNVHEKHVLIDVGPPVVARFVQPTMMWDDWEIVYVEDDDVSRFEDRVIACNGFFEPLGRHFYSVRGC